MYVSMCCPLHVCREDKGIVAFQVEMTSQCLGGRGFIVGFLVLFL